MTPDEHDWVAQAHAMLDAAGLYRIAARQWVPVVEGLLRELDVARRRIDDLERDQTRRDGLAAPVWPD
jgi:hypothetical protein